MYQVLQRPWLDICTHCEKCREIQVWKKFNSGNGNENYKKTSIWRNFSGWIHTLLEEAENERMHLMTFMELKKPGPLFKYAVVTTQFFFTMGFSFAYLISPNFCHRYVVLHFIWQGKRFNSGNGNKNLKKYRPKNSSNVNLTEFF